MPQMATVSRAGPGIPSWSPTWEAQAPVLEPSLAAFPEALAGDWIETGAAKIPAGAPT